MSSQEIQRQIDAATQKEEAEDPSGKRMPVGSLLTAIVYAGKDTAGQLCPVFALRLRGPDGRVLADGLRQTMRTWGEAP
jgi:hypothetical protein